MKTYLAVGTFAFTLCVGVCLRLLGLHTVWQYDEIVYRLVAANMLKHGQLVEKAYYGQPTQEFLYQPPWYPHLLAAWFWLTHPTIYDARVLGVIFSAGTLVFSWLLMRRLADAPAALFAVVPLVFDGWLLYIQGQSYIENLVLLVIVAGLWLYQRALDRPSWRRFMAVGLVLGAAGCLKYTGLYVLLGVALSWLILRREHAGHGIALGSAAGLLGLDQMYLVVRYGSAYTSETAVQVRRVLGLQGSDGSANSPVKMVHLLLSQYDIFIPSFLVAVGGVILVIAWLLRCYRARSWEPVQDKALLFSWAVAGLVTFGLSSIRYPQYFALILVPLYLLVWLWLWQQPRRNLGYALAAFAVLLGVVSYHFSTERQAVNPYAKVQQYVAARLPAHAVVLADEQVGDLLTQPYCREQDATPCKGHATYAVTWDTYLQQTQKLGDAAFTAQFKGATKLYSSTGFSGTATVWKLRADPATPKPVLGVDVATDQDYSLSQATAYGDRLMPYIRNTLHATAVGIVWDLCDQSFTSDKVTRCKQSLSVADVRELVKLAHVNKLTVQLRPIIRVGPPRYWNDPPKSWEGHINPRNERAWFASLQAAEKPYAGLLSRGSQMVAATEFSTQLARSKDWTGFLAATRRECHGCAVSVALWDRNYLEGIAPSVADPGVDWYPPLDVPNHASQKRVTNAWESSLDAIPSKRRKVTTLDEESIRATAGAYANPAAWNKNGPADPTVQVRYFVAACETVAHYKMAGLYFYDIPLNDDPAHPFNFAAYFVGNAGSKAIAECAKILRVP